MYTLVCRKALRSVRDESLPTLPDVVWDLFPYDFEAVSRSYDEWVASMSGERFTPSDEQNGYSNHALGGTQFGVCDVAE